jgi:hypothetical protein
MRHLVPVRVNRVQHNRETALPLVCKISPDIACILLLNHPRQNENIKEWRGVAHLGNMAKMKGFAPFSFISLFRAQ